jgi:DNA-directed RNA polymerases I, II, and III subunit RPABC2
LNEKIEYQKANPFRNIPHYFIITMDPDEDFESGAEESGASDSENEAQGPVITKKKTAVPAAANDSDAEPEDSEAEDDEDADENGSDVDENGSDAGSDIGEEAADLLDPARPFSEFDNDFSDDDDEEEDDNYLQKFDAETQKKIISEHHPELQAHNYDEVEILSRVVRDENGNIIDPLHKTLPFITKYEKARILGERAKQLDAGAQALVEVDPSVIDGYLIALKEFEAKAIPFIIQRPLPSGASEYWKFSDLEILA